MVTQWDINDAIINSTSPRDPRHGEAQRRINLRYRRMLDAMNENARKYVPLPPDQ